MPRILLVYASTHGHTAKIARRVAEVMQGAGADVPLLRADEAPHGRLDRYDAVVVAASVHAGRHQREMVRWVSRNALELAALPSVFLSVSLSAADDSEESRGHVRAAIDYFVDETGWPPKRVEAIAGALQYREYSVFTRALMRLVVGRLGNPEPDTGRDHDYTDWDALDRIATEIAQTAGARTPAVA